MLMCCAGLTNVRVVWSRAEDGAREQDLRDVSTDPQAGGGGMHWREGVGRHCVQDIMQGCVLNDLELHLWCAL